MKNVFLIIRMMKRFLFILLLTTPSLSWADNLFGMKIGSNVIDYFIFSDVFKESDVYGQQNGLEYFIADVTDLMDSADKSPYFSQYSIVYDSSATIHQVAALKEYVDKDRCANVGATVASKISDKLSVKLLNQGKYTFPERDLYFVYDNLDIREDFGAGVYCNNYLDTGPEMFLFVSSSELRKTEKKYYNKF